MNCRVCKNTMPDEETYCPHCGANQKEEPLPVIAETNQSEFLGLSFLMGIASIVTGLFCLWVFYLSFIPVGLAIFGLVKTKEQRDNGDPSTYALVANFTGLVLGSIGIILLFLVLVTRWLTGIFPTPTG